MIAIQASERNGRLVGAVLVDESDELILVSTGGILIRTKVAQIREMGRSTQGVSLINLDAGTKLAGIEKVLETEENGIEGEEVDDGVGAVGDDGGTEGSDNGNGSDVGGEATPPGEGPAEE